MSLNDCIIEKKTSYQINILLATSLKLNKNELLLIIKYYKSPILLKTNIQRIFKKGKF